MLPLLLVSMDVSVLYFAVPAISADLEPSGTQQLWIFDIYGFVLAGLLITMGSLGDRIGRRRLLLIGAAAFGAASVRRRLREQRRDADRRPRAARRRRRDPDAVDDGADPQHVPRPRPAREGDRHLVRRDDRRHRARPGAWAACCCEHFWWGSVFLVNLPGDGAAAGPRRRCCCPSSRTPRPGRFDLLERRRCRWPPCCRSSTASRRSPADGCDRVAVRCRSPSACSFGALFVRRQRTARAPDDRPGAVPPPRLRSAVVAQPVATFAMMGSAIFTTQYLQSVLGKSPLEAALWSLLPSVAGRRRRPGRRARSRGGGPRVRHRRRVRRRRRRLRAAGPGRHGLRCGSCWSAAGVLAAGHRHRDVPGHRPGARHGPRRSGPVRPRPCWRPARSSAGRSGMAALGSIGNGRLPARHG